jgi:hypothetical protein
MIFLRSKTSFLRRKTILLRSKTILRRSKTTFLRSKTTFLRRKMTLLRSKTVFLRRKIILLRSTGIFLRRKAPRACRGDLGEPRPRPPGSASQQGPPWRTDRPVAVRRGGPYKAKGCDSNQRGARLPGVPLRPHFAKPRSHRKMCRPHQLDPTEPQPDRTEARRRSRGQAWRPGIPIRK